MQEKNQINYKKFTAQIQTPTLLDDFAPASIEAIAKRFKPVKTLQGRYCDDLQCHANTINVYQGFEDIATELLNSMKSI